MNWPSKTTLLRSRLVISCKVDGLLLAASNVLLCYQVDGYCWLHFTRLTVYSWLQVFRLAAYSWLQVSRLTIYSWLQVMFCSATKQQVTTVVLHHWSLQWWNAGSQLQIITIMNCKSSSSSWSQSQTYSHHHINELQNIMHYKSPLPSYWIISHHHHGHHHAT